MFNFIISTVTVLKYGKTRINSKKLVKDIVDDQTEHYVGNSTFGIAISYVRRIDGSRQPNLFADKTYFTVSFSNYQFLRTEENPTQQIQTNTIIEMTNCSQSTLPGLNPVLYNRKNMTNYLWPSHTNYYLRGDFNSLVFSGVQIIINKWVNTTENGNHCKSDEEIVRAARSGFVDVAYLNAYFDFDDYDSPIKPVLSSSNNIFMTADNNTQWFETTIQENQAYTSDKRLYGEQFNKNIFYSISEKTHQSIHADSTYGALVYISFMLSREHIRFERNVYIFNDMTSFLGGLFDSFLFVGYIIVCFFQSRLFDLKLIRALYQVEDKANPKDQIPAQPKRFMKMATVHYFTNLIDVKMKKMRRGWVRAKE